MENSIPPPGTPPPLVTPPPVITPPPPAKPRRSWGWMIVSVVLIVLPGFSLIGNVVQSFTHSLGGGFNRGFKTSTMREAGPRLDEVLLEDNGSRNKIAATPGGGTLTKHR